MPTVENKLKASSFDGFGNFSLGIKEHIEIPGTRYDPVLGIFGMDVCITMKKPGFRVKNRRIAPNHIPKRHRITKEETIKFFIEQYKVEVIA